ncbi:hypothetical protein ABER99_20170 [Paenibacillus glucanolyticus]|jgi:hypothetical protein|uniref:Uncharacterized protein n=1 Tax=Paenibacillus glucanolyticus TaxID=59843 RepID=A0A163GLH6_9BACL|nr:hypothetical protein [Paenibacillus glucanolyticus]KZS45033.1 hypothetical protein AWU65_03360 [Paenibacillus glucanolyticus]OMF66730.1 hypothetical protein BK142_29355 [Paenibacillus glucanolyticus]
MNVLAKKIEEFNQKLMESEKTCEHYIFTRTTKDLVLTEEKLNMWKRKASAGSVILGAIDCRYLIVLRELQYGFLNIDDAGWEMCEPVFSSTDELIEWFAFNLDNPIIEVTSGQLTEKLINRDKIEIQEEEYYTVYHQDSHQEHKWSCCPSLSTLKMELLSLADKETPLDQVCIITPEGERFNYDEMVSRIIADPIVIGGNTIHSLKQIDDAMARELKGHYIAHLQNPYNESVDGELITYSVYQCPKCHTVHRIDSDLQAARFQKNDAGFFKMFCFDCA